MTDWFALNSTEQQALWLSLQAGILCSLLSLPFALGIGYFMARKNFWGKSLVESLIHLPLVMPPVTTGYLLLLVFGTNGIVGKWLYSTFQLKIAFSFYAVIIASAVVSFPLFVRSIRTAFEMIDSQYESASRLLGANQWKTFFRVSLPLASNGVMAGMILSFTRSLGEFGATITFAGNIEGLTQTLPLAIYTNMQIPGQDEATLKLVLISVVISVVAMILSEGFIKKMKHAKR